MPTTRVLSSPFPVVFFRTWLFIIQLPTTSNLLKPEPPLQCLYGHRRKVKYVKPWCVREWGALGTLAELEWPEARRQWNSKKKKESKYPWFSSSRIPADNWFKQTSTCKALYAIVATQPGTVAVPHLLHLSRAQLKFHHSLLPLDALALYLCLIYRTSNSAFLWRYLSNSRRLPKG